MTTCTALARAPYRAVISRPSCATIWTNPALDLGFPRRLPHTWLTLISKLIPRVDHDRAGALEVLCHSSPLLQLSARRAGHHAVPRPQPANGRARIRRPVRDGFSAQRRSPVPPPLPELQCLRTGTHPGCAVFAGP